MSSDLAESEILEIWEERAAIREFCGGESRVKAEFSAAMEIRRQIGFIPNAIREVMEITKRGS
jgi:hypothetical protein